MNVLHLKISFAKLSHLMPCINDLYVLRALIQYHTSIGNPIVEIRRSHDRLISTMGFPILVRKHLYIESGPCMWQIFSAYHLIHPPTKRNLSWRLNFVGNSMLSLSAIFKHFIPWSNQINKDNLLTIPVSYVNNMIDGNPRGRHITRILPKTLLLVAWIAILY